MAIIVFVLSTFLGFMRTVFEIKNDNKLNGWGKTYIGLLILFFGIGIYAIVIDWRKVDKEELRLNSKNKADSVARRLERKRDSLSIFKLDGKLIRLESSLKKGGYSFDSIKGQIISPRNIQIVETGGSALQTNAPNYGLQAGRDININPERQLSENDKKVIIE